MTLPPFRLGRRPSAANRDFFGRNGKETLRFPLPVPARLAVVNADFHLAWNMRRFDSDDLPALSSYAPDALALPLNSALSLADRKLRGLWELPSLRLAIVVFSSVDVSEPGPLAPRHRDILWKAFGLPVFEQLRGWDSRVIARECEVHDGLHFDANAVIVNPERHELLIAGVPTRFPSEIVSAHCDCGNETPRLRHRSAAKARAAAA